MSGACHDVATRGNGCRRKARSAALMLGALALALAGLLSVPATAHNAARNASGPADMSRPHVYLMRGLLNVFSLGMDQLAAQIQSRGIAADVYNHTLAGSVVADIVQRYRAGDRGPYILVGHSLGADAVMTMAQALNQNGVPVALVVPFDGTGSYAASPNVACVLNVTQRQYAYMRPGTGFHGMLRNLDVSADTSIDHFTIDKSPRLQATALSLILQTAHAENCRPAGGAVVARPKDAPGRKDLHARNELPAKIETPAKNDLPAKNNLPAKNDLPAKSASPTLRPGYEG